MEQDTQEYKNPSEAFSYKNINENSICAFDFASTFDRSFILLAYIGEEFPNENAKNLVVGNSIFQLMKKRQT